MTPQLEPAALRRPLAGVRLGGAEGVRGSVQFAPSSSPGSLRGPGMDVCSPCQVSSVLGQRLINLSRSQTIAGLN